MAKMKISLHTGVTSGGRFYIANGPSCPFHEVDGDLGKQLIDKSRVGGPLGVLYVEPPTEDLEAAEKAEADRKAALLKKDEEPSPLQPKWLEEAEGILAKKLEEVPENAMAVVTEGAETKKALMENVKTYVEALLDSGSE